MLNLPLGFHFHPSDDEIISILRAKVARIELFGISDIVLDRDVFDKTPPWDLFSSVNSAATIGYFFTPLKRKSTTGKNVKRVVANSGTWTGETTGNPIYDPHTNDVIGTKKYFTFRQDSAGVGKRIRSADKDGFIWTMHEFVLLGEKPDFSLCQIAKKPEKTSEDDQEDVLLQRQSFDVSNPHPSSSVSRVSSYDPPQFQNNNSFNALMASSSWQIIDDYPPPLNYKDSTTHSVSRSDEFFNFDVIDPDAFTSSYPQFKNNTTPLVLNASKPQFENGFSMSMISDYRDNVNILADNDDDQSFQNHLLDTLDFNL